MLSTGFLLTVALAELAALLLALCVVFGHGIWLRREQRLRTRIEGKSVTILVTALDACSLGSDDRAYLQRTPRRMQIGALMQLAPHLRAGEHARAAGRSRTDRTRAGS